MGFVPREWLVVDGVHSSVGFRDQPQATHTLARTHTALVRLDAMWVTAGRLGGFGSSDPVSLRVCTVLAERGKRRNADRRNDVH